MVTVCVVFGSVEFVQGERTISAASQITVGLW